MKDLILAETLTNIDNELYCNSNEFPNLLFFWLCHAKIQSPNKNGQSNSSFLSEWSERPIKYYRLTWSLRDHRDYKRIEAASRYKFSQARGSNWSLLMGGKFKSRMQIPDVRWCSYLLLHDRLFTTRYDEKTRKGEGEKNKMPRKKFSHSKFLKQKLRQKMVKISTGLT